MGAFSEMEEKKQRIELKRINVPVMKVIPLAVRSSIKKTIFSKTGKDARQLCLNIEKTVIQLSKSGGTSKLRISRCTIKYRTDEIVFIFRKNLFIVH
jgi:hypothetical protein